MREPSHARAFFLGGLLAQFAAADLDAQDVSTGRITQEVDRWLANAQPPADRAAEARAMIERHAVEDLSGTRPREVTGTLCCTQRAALVIGRLLTRHQS